MRKLILTTAALILTAVAVTQLAGCTLIGAGIGAAASTKTKTIPGWQLVEVKEGARVRLFMKDGTWLVGTYIGSAVLPKASYAEAYGAWRDQRAEPVPALGEGVTTTLTSGAQVQGAFAGFDYDALYVQPPGTARVAEAVPFGEVAAVVDSKKQYCDREALREMTTKGDVPLHTVHRIRTGKSVVRFDPREVQHVVVQGKNYAGIGALIGLGIDALILANTIDLSNDEPRRRPSNQEEYSLGSCPYVYSYDGDRHVLDAEPFGGALFRAAQRTDLERLGHLRAVEGSYHLKVTNELPETQYIDALKLLVVDHPLGTQVVPSFAGDLHVLSEPRTPTAATDFAGHDVLDLVGVQDDRFWISNPFNRNPDDRVQVRDGLVLTFSRPEASSSVTLALRAKNTLWASHLVRDHLALYGEGLDQWYTLVNESEEARAAWLNAFIREGMLTVEVWNGTAWQPAGFIWGTGLVVAKDQALKLDLTNVDGADLRVRLSSTAGFWTLDRVVVDYTPISSLHVEERAPRSATGHDGADLREALRAIDGRYYEMPTTDYRAEVVFEAIPLRPGQQRTFLIKATGYYRVHMEATGKPDYVLLSRFLTEPGAFGQYTLRKLNAYAASAQAALEQEQSAARAPGRSR